MRYLKRANGDPKACRLARTLLSLKPSYLRAESTAVVEAWERAEIALLDRVAIIGGWEDPYGRVVPDAGMAVDRWVQSVTP